MDYIDNCINKIKNKVNNLLRINKGYLSSTLYSPLFIEYQKEHKKYIKELKKYNKDQKKFIRQLKRGIKKVNKEFTK